MKKVLVVEDNPMVLKSVEFKLTKDGHQITTAQNGRDALNLLQKERFDLVLTDLIMPFVTGIQLIEAINKNGIKTPVIVLSSSTQEATVMDAFDLGARDFISKPFSPQELSLRVKRTLDLN